LPSRLCRRYPTAFDGRSDYGPIVTAGIPAGGSFTGADGIKTKEEATIYRGTAGEQ
jgi:Zn-dependent M28 family amino/carboxypeptidase